MMRLGSADEDYRASYEYRVEDAGWIVVVKRVWSPLRNKGQRFKIDFKQKSGRNVCE
jgi:hypothetical protein